MKRINLSLIFLAIIFTHAGIIKCATTNYTVKNRTNAPVNFSYTIYRTTSTPKRTVLLQPNASCTVPFNTATETASYSANPAYSSTYPQPSNTIGDARTPISKSLSYNIVVDNISLKINSTEGKGIVTNSTPFTINLNIPKRKNPAIVASKGTFQLQDGATSIQASIANQPSGPANIAHLGQVTGSWHGTQIKSFNITMDANNNLQFS